MPIIHVIVLKTYQTCRLDDSSENIHHIEWFAVWAEQLHRIPCSPNLRRRHRDNCDNLLKLVKTQKLLLTVVIVRSNEHSTGPSVFYTLISVS